jgi:hypothetical protein
MKAHPQSWLHVLSMTGWQTWDILTARHDFRRRFSGADGGALADHAFLKGQPRRASVQIV